MNRINGKSLLLLPTLSFTSIPTMAATPFNQVQTLLQTKLEKDQLGVGFAAALIQGDKVQYLNLGHVLKDQSQATTSDHLFEIGSVTKTFTAVALASMVKEGKIKLSDAVQNHLPKSVKLPIKNGKAITFVSLSNHSSGLPRLPTNLAPKDPLDPYADYSVTMMYDFLNNHTLTREVGKSHEYSNLGAGLLGHVLSLIDNKSYQQMITDRVFKPLGMKHSYVDVPANQLAMLSDGHDSELNKSKHWKLPTLAGAGAIKSTTRDMVKYVKANLNRKPLAGALTLTQKPTADFNEHGAKIGLGWITNTHDKGSYIWHNGGTGGFRTFVGFDHANNRGIVLLANSIYGVDDIGNAYLSSNLSELIKKNSEALTLSQGQLQKLIGEYELVPGFALTVTHDDKGLLIQATGQGRLPVYAQSATEFIYKVVSAKVVFDVDDKGYATAVTLHQGGQTLKGKKKK
jgi:D-alanyl-D-alanine-carboxypeptidase/D-alanyl-D-alanine-endopeptidase